MISSYLWEKDLIITTIIPPPSIIQQQKFVPVILKLKYVYNIWQQIFIDFPKAKKFTLGTKIDQTLLSTIEYGFLASYASVDRKILLIEKTEALLDLLKLFLMLSWEIKAIKTSEYVKISEPLLEIGRMLGGWKKSIQQKTPDLKNRKKN